MASSATKWTSLIFCLACAGMARPVHACIDIAPIVIDDIRQADAVFKGEMIGYERIMRHGGRRYAVLKFRVDKVLKGEVPKEVSLYWSNSTFGIPEHLDLPRTLLVGAVRSGNDKLPLRAPSATIFPTQRPDLLQLLQAPCSAAFLLYSSPGNMEDIQRILNGGKVKEHSYFGGPQWRMEAEEARDRRLAKEAQKRRMEHVLLALGALLSVGAIVLFWKLSRIRKNA